MPLDPLTAGLELANTIADKVFPDADAAQKRELAVMLGQLEVNKAEGANANWFVAGWRPAVGWICALALAYTYLGYPMLLWVHSLFPSIDPPRLGTDGMLFELLFGMLGLGAMRTVEKIKGVEATGPVDPPKFLQRKPKEPGPTAIPRDFTPGV